MSYINIYYQSLEENLNRKNMLKYLFKIFHENDKNNKNKRIIEIREAPNKTLMKKYGGSYTVNEYKDLLLKVDNIYEN